MNKTELQESYITHNGKFEKELNSIRTADMTAMERKILDKYYDYYDCGIAPKGAENSSNIETQRYLERQLNIAIAKAYKRKFKKTSRLSIIFYSLSKIQTFTEWNNSQHATIN